MWALCQDIIWTSDDLLSVEPLRPLFIEFVSESKLKLFIQHNALEKFVCKMGAIFFQPEHVKVAASGWQGAIVVYTEGSCQHLTGSNMNKISQLWIIVILFFNPDGKCYSLALDLMFWLM